MFFLTNLHFIDIILGAFLKGGIFMESSKYKSVYTMTNENLGCLSQLYDFD